ncbi:hypothetical protein niasHT_033064 [Heterodera trifolii]|uniref:Uncharacterized protein n=1 Tax=Heterodera trifolii TaxID=157864 RepID=A0ABD2IZJ8_9BILA
MTDCSAAVLSTRLMFEEMDRKKGGGRKRKKNVCRAACLIDSRTADRTEKSIKLSEKEIDFDKECPSMAQRRARKWDGSESLRPFGVNCEWTRRTDHQLANLFIPSDH